MLRRILSWHIEGKRFCLEGVADDDGAMMGQRAPPAAQTQTLLYYDAMRAHTKALQHHIITALPHHLETHVSFRAPVASFHAMYYVVVVCKKINVRDDPRAHKKERTM